MVPGSLLGQARISAGTPDTPVYWSVETHGDPPDVTGVHGRLERGFEPEDPHFGDRYSTEPERRDFTIVQ